MEQEEIRFPLFIDLNGRKAVVVGGGAIACRRAGVLKAFGAQVTLIAPEWKEHIEGVRGIQRPYQSGDLDGAVLAVAATDNRAVNRLMGEDARALGIPVSVADRGGESTFLYPPEWLRELVVAR